MNDRVWSNEEEVILWLKFLANLASDEMSWSSDETIAESCEPKFKPFKFIKILRSNKFYLNISNMIHIVSPFEEYVRSLLDWSHINNAGGSKLPVGDFCIEFKITSFPSMNSSTMFNVLRTIRIPTPTLMHSTRRKSPFEEISFVDLDISCIIYIETVSQSFWLDKHCFIMIVVKLWTTSWTGRRRICFYL